MIKALLDFKVLRLVARRDVDRTLVADALARPCKVDWPVLCLHDRPKYETKTGKLSRVCVSAPMLRKLAGSTEESVAGTDSVRPSFW